MCPLGSQVILESSDQLTKYEHFFLVTGKGKVCGRCTYKHMYRQAPRQVDLKQYAPNHLTGRMVWGGVIKRNSTDSYCTWLVVVPSSAKMAEMTLPWSSMFRK